MGDKQIVLYVSEAQQRHLAMFFVWDAVRVHVIVAAFVSPAGSSCCAEMSSSKEGHV